MTVHSYILDCTPWLFIWYISWYHFWKNYRVWWPNPTYPLWLSTSEQHAKKKKYHTFLLINAPKDDPQRMGQHSDVSAFIYVGTFGSIVAEEKHRELTSTNSRGICTLFRPPLCISLCTQIDIITNKLLLPLAPYKIMSRRNVIMAHVDGLIIGYTKTDPNQCSRSDMVAVGMERYSRGCTINDMRVEE